MKNKTKLLLETVADIAYNAGVAKFYTGDSRADMQTFIHLATQFENKYKDVNWNAQVHEKDGHLDYITEVELFCAEEFERIYRTMDKQFPVVTLDFTPDAAKEPWDNIEIEKCTIIPNDSYDKNNPENTPYEEEYFVEPIRDDKTEPDFWSVYLHQVEGGVQCIADLPDEKTANDLAALINHAVRSFKDNGYMALYDNKKLQEEMNELFNKALNDHNFGLQEWVRKHFEFLQRDLNKLFI